MIIDTHAHVWSYESRYIPGSRYVPNYFKPIDAYLSILETNAVTHGVLVQPSFLGINNEYLLESLRSFPNRLRGVVVIPPDISEQRLHQLDERGVVGVRFNLYGVKDFPDFSDVGFDHLFQWINKKNWHIEIHAEGEQWLKIIPDILKRNVQTVIDHFGRPNLKKGIDCDGFKTILKAGESGLLWVKLSAPYRIDSENTKTYANLLLQAFGENRLIWGSDFPWTQNESQQDYSKQIKLLKKYFNDESLHEKILTTNAMQLFHFA